MNTWNISTAGDRGRIGVILTASIVFLVAGSVGAYLDWRWWADLYSGLMITLAAGAILLVGGSAALIAALVGRRNPRRIALVALAVGIGLVAGEKLGPSREPLISQPNGAMTLRLDSPLVLLATGPANCQNVASASEFRVWGATSIRPNTPNRPFVWIDFDTGDRWEVARDAPRKDGVRLTIAFEPEQSSALQAMESSTLESTFTNEGGLIRFANLVAPSGQVITGEYVDLAGTLEWTCGAAPQ